jgi:3-hydroxyisobutyrate dehydrogenase-like beta-hydroxyacid dehydrogenase
VGKRKVGYIGLGNIGKPCAERLLGDFAVHVYDIDSVAVADLAGQGATGSDTVAELATACDHVGICVRDDAQVEALLYGSEGIFANAAAGAVIAIHSTVTQANILRWAGDGQAAGVELIDAPVTGGAHRAAQGTLCYMVGGDAAVVERCRPVFETSGDKIVHAGAVGAGIALKLCNNFIQYAEFVAMAEATRLAESCGLSVDVLREVGLSNGVVNEQMHLFVSGRNGMARAGSEAQMQQIFGALGKLGRKDLQCALDTAANHGVRMPTAEFVHERIEDVFLARDPSRPPREEVTSAT